MFFFDSFLPLLFSLSLFSCCFYFPRVLLRVRMLYYIKHEVLGDLVNQINEGANARYIRFNHHKPLPSIVSGGIHVPPKRFSGRFTCLYLSTVPPPRLKSFHPNFLSPHFMPQNAFILVCLYFVFTISFFANSMHLESSTSSCSFFFSKLNYPISDTVLN